MKVETVHYTSERIIESQGGSHGRFQMEVEIHD